MGADEFALEAEHFLREGKLIESLSKLTERIREEPADAELRLFLFQLLCVLGDWDGAMTHLNVAVELDPKNLLLANVCRSALNCEALRQDVFAGKRPPLVLGEPPAWVAQMIEANQLTAEGHYQAASNLRERARAAAPAIPGTIAGHRFEWIADMDSRLGPLLEAIIDGRYYWVPFAGLRAVQLESPNDLRDVAWLPARFRWANGGEAFGLVPSRYPGSERHEDPAIQMARKTIWVARDDDLYLGLGQRMFATDQGEYPLFEAQRIVLEHSGE